MVLARFWGRVVYAQKLSRLRVSAFPLVYGDKVEDFVVLAAMHGHSDADRHFDLGPVCEDLQVNSALRRPQ